MVAQKYYERIDKCNSPPKGMESPYHSERFYAGYLSPSGRVSISVLARSKTAQSDKEYERTRPLSTGYTVYELDDTGDTAEVYEEYTRTDSLGLSSESNYHSDIPKVRYGLKGISVNGRKKVREGCYLLQKKYGRRLGFYTLTCPYTDDVLIYEYNRNLAEISRRYFQSLKREFHRAEQTFSYVSVYEYQTYRYQQTGIPVLHIHYVAPCYLRGTKEFIVTADRLREIYYNICNQVIGGEPNTSASIDAAVIRESAVGYISKYMSKGGDICESLSQNCPEQVPRQWWSMSSNVKSAIQIATTTIPDSICAYLYSGGGQEADEVLYIYNRCYIEVYCGRDFKTGHERYIKVGMSAQMGKVGMSAMQSWDIADIPI